MKWLTMAWSIIAGRAEINTVIERGCKYAGIDEIALVQSWQGNDH